MKYQKLLVNKFNITLDKQGRLVLNDQKSLCHTMNHRDLFSLFRSSHQRCSVKKGALKKICKFHRKTPVLESLQACNFIKKRLQHWCFLVKFAKFLRTYILKTICERLLLFVSPQDIITNGSFQPSSPGVWN